MLKRNTEGEREEQRFQKSQDMTLTSHALEHISSLAGQFFLANAESDEDIKRSLMPTTEVSIKYRSKRLLSLLESPDWRFFFTIRFSLNKKILSELLVRNIFRMITQIFNWHLED